MRIGDISLKFENFVTRYIPAIIIFSAVTALPAHSAEINLDEFTEKVKFEDSTFTLPLGLQADNFYIPPNNPMTKNKIELGRALFFDVRLSANNTVSCATCHAPDMGFADHEPVFIGINQSKGPRNSPTAINRAFSKTQFWDGRASSLEELALEPLIRPIVMGNPSYDAVIKKLRKIEGYEQWFKRVFKRSVNLDDYAKAISAFQRTIVSGGSRVDRYNMGDEKALSESEKRGLKLFKEKARCNQCHAGFNFTDEKFHNIGVGWDKGKLDLGRYGVTKKQEDIGSFKTPTLRDITQTAPYMHDGRLATLEQVIDFYNEGGSQNPFLDKEIVKLNLSGQDKKDLVDFLKALDGKGWRDIKAPKSLP